MISRTLNYIFIVIIVILAVAMVRDYYTPASVADKVFQPAPEPREVIKYKTLVLGCPENPEMKVVYLDKDSAGKDDNVPEAARGNENKQITAIAEVPPWKGKTTVAAVFDMGTGRTSIDYRQERLRFFGFENLKELGIKYGLGTGGTLGAVYGRYTFFRTGSLKYSASAEMNTEAAWFIGGGIRYEWN